MSFTLIAQTSSAEQEKLKKANEETIAAYKVGKFGDALKQAQTALDLTIKIFGAEHLETATSYSNLGEIYSAGKKYKEAFKIFKRHWLSINKIPSKMPLELQKQPKD